MNEHPALFEDTGPDFRFKGSGHRRSHVGAVVEEVVCALMRWERQKIDSTKGGVSMDARDAKGKGIEIKSVAVSATMNGKSVLYDWRIAKERAKAPGMAYAFVCRQSKGTGRPSTMGRFLDKMSRDPLTIILAPSSTVHALALAEPHHEAPKKRTRGNKGYTREGYADGYRNLPIQTLLDFGHSTMDVSCTLWGRSFAARVLILPHAGVELPLD